MGRAAIRFMGVSIGIILGGCQLAARDWGDVGIGTMSVPTCRTATPALKADTFEIEGPDVAGRGESVTLSSSEDLNCSPQHVLWNGTENGARTGTELRATFGAAGDYVVFAKVEGPDPTTSATLLHRTVVRRERIFDECRVQDGTQIWVEERRELTVVSEGHCRGQSCVLANGSVAKRCSHDSLSNSESIAYAIRARSMTSS